MHAHAHGHEAQQGIENRSVTRGGGQQLLRDFENFRVALKQLLDEGACAELASCRVQRCRHYDHGGVQDCKAWTNTPYVTAAEAEGGKRQKKCDA